MTYKPKTGWNRSCEQEAAAKTNERDISIDKIQRLQTVDRWCIDEQDSSAQIDEQRTHVRINK